MLRIAALAALLTVATPASAETEREAAINTLAGLYNSVDVCHLTVFRSKLEGVADGLRPKDDARFNVDVFFASQALYKAQKNWTKEQLDTYCAASLETAKKLGVIG